MFIKKNLLAGNLFAAALVLLLLLIVGTQTFAQEQRNTQANADLTQMSLEELMNVEVTSTATLTKTTRRLTPAAITVLTKEDISASGARSLFELLDIYVPNLQWIRHHWEADHMGLRGIINDRDDKYLLLVNGRIMNERTHYGALSERDLVLLQDIHHIDIVRGPGSGIYGPGAISMVINIVTDNFSTFQGTEVTSRIGAIEEFYSGEFKHGQAFDDNDGGVFLYGGVAKYVGASQYEAPQIFATDFPDDVPWGGGQELPSEFIERGEPVTSLALNRDGETHRNVPPLKLHVQITRGNWDIWARYTRGGQQFTWDVGPLAHFPLGWGTWVWPQNQSSAGYQQATGYIGYKQELTKDIDIDYTFSYDMFDFERYHSNTIQQAYREDEYLAKALMHWQLNDRHELALGAEFSHNELGLRSLGWQPDEPAIDVRFDSEHVPMPQWATNMYSLVGEHQWTINDQWTTFLGARLDNHTYTGWMFSPRAVVAYTPSDKDTFKVMWSRSVRTNFEEETKVQDINNGELSDPEKLDSAELRYERQHNKNLSFAGSLFLHYNLELISHSYGKNVPLGTQKEWGAELEAVYRTEKTRLTLSHGYTKLIDFDLSDPSLQTLSTAEPYGYGHDLANWSNHITKLNAQHKLNDRWTLDSSLRIYWGFPGRKDYSQYKPSPISGGTPATDPGWERAYRASIYLNLGLQYKPNNDLTIGVNGYNLLGIFNKDFNKRIYYDGYGDFRSHAPAVGVSMQYKF